MDGALLVGAARAAIAGDLGLPLPPEPVAPAWALEPGAAFVTLHRDGRLRGCIGSLEAWRPLLTDVRANARAAAFRDPRFAPLTRAEYDDLEVEVSVLTPPEPLAFTDEADLLAQLVPHVDGLILEAAGRRGTFLPQVWEQLPDPADFLGALKRKAGLPASYWGRDVRVSRYHVTKFKEADDG